MKAMLPQRSVFRIIPFFADITSLIFITSLRKEWDGLRPHLMDGVAIAYGQDMIQCRG